MLSLLTSSAIRIVLSAAEAVGCHLPKGKVPSQQLPLISDAASTAQTLHRWAKIDAYAELSRAPGQWRPTHRRVAAAYAKPTPAPFPVSLTIGPCAALRPVVSSASIDVARSKPCLTVIEALVAADIAPSFERPQPILLPVERPVEKVAPVSPPDISTASFALCPTRIPRLPKPSKPRRHSLSRIGQVKVFTLRMWLSDSPFPLGGPEYARAKAHGLRWIAQEEPYERAIEAAAWRCPPDIAEDSTTICTRLAVRFDDAMERVLDELLGPPEDLLPAPGPILPVSPLAPATHRRWVASTDLGVRVPFSKGQKQRAAKAKKAGKNADLRKIVLHKSYALRLSA